MLVILGLIASFVQDYGDKILLQLLFLISISSCCLFFHLLLAGDQVVVLSNYVYKLR